MQKIKIDKTDIKEKLIFFGFSIGLFLPIRLAFYNFVDTWWLGSFGIISAVMILMLYLVKKEKLGYIGRVWKRQIIKISKGKLGIFGIVQSLFFISMLGSIVFLTDMNLGTTNQDLMREMYAAQGITDLQSFIIGTGELDFTGLLVYENWVDIYNMVNSDPEFLKSAFGGGYAMVDEFTGGYHQHFNIVFLVEEIETLGLVIYFRWFYKRKENKIGKM